MLLFVFGLLSLMFVSNVTASQWHRLYQAGHETLETSGSESSPVGLGSQLAGRELVNPPPSTTARGQAGHEFVSPPPSTTARGTVPTKAGPWLDAQPTRGPGRRPVPERAPADAPQWTPSRRGDVKAIRHSELGREAPQHPSDPETQQISVLVSTIRHHHHQHHHHRYHQHHHHHHHHHRHHCSNPSDV